MMTGRIPSLLGTSSRDATEVVIAGGGIAALEAALALHALAGDRVAVTLLAPAPEFVYQPMAVLEPYERMPPRRLSLVEFTAKVDATVIQDTLVSVDAPARRLVTGTGRELGYDALLVTVGACERNPLADAILLHPRHSDERLSVLIEELDGGSVHSVAFVAPTPAWPLPVYELALLARERADEAGAALDLAIVTAEATPLDVFGDAVSEATAKLLAIADIRVFTGSAAARSAGNLIVRPGETELSVDRVVAIPRLEGPRIGGLPCDAHGFLPVSAQCAVAGVEGVYAAGDATNFPVKFGAIAAQQADAAAEAIAARAGADVEPEPFDARVHGVLLSGQRERLYFSARILDGEPQESLVSAHPTWSPEAKVAARYLGPYLDELWASGIRWFAGELAWERTLARLRADAAAAS